MLIIVLQQPVNNERSVELQVMETHYRTCLANLVDERVKRRSPSLRGRLFDRRDSPEPHSTVLRVRCCLEVGCERDALTSCHDEPSRLQPSSKPRSLCELQRLRRRCLQPKTGTRSSSQLQLRACRRSCCQRDNALK